MSDLDPIDLDRVVVIGASLAGLTAAATLRSGGFDGDLIVVEAAADMPADRPPLSKQVLAGAMEPGAAIATLAGRVEGLDVDLRFDHAVAGAGFAADDLRIKFFNDHEMTADGIVIATGSAARWPDGFRVETDESTANEPKWRSPLAGVHVVRTLDDSLGAEGRSRCRRRRRLVVIGAGFIGAEVAATARAAGSPSPWSSTHRFRWPACSVASWASSSPNCTATRGSTSGSESASPTSWAATTVGSAGVTLTDGTTIAADVVVLGLGAAPDLGWLEGSGLTVDNGVVCDETLWAGPGVVAAGDVANWLNPVFGERMRVEHWENAIEQGEAAARRLLAARDGAEPQAFASVPWFWSDQYDCKMQLAGRPGPDDEIVLIDGDPADRRFAVAFKRGDRCTGVFASNRPRAVVIARMKMAESLDWAHVVGDR